MVGDDRTCALVGDVVTSRRFLDEVALVDGLARILHEVNAQVPARMALRLVVRDEFHAVYAHPAQALEATLRLRLLTDDLVLQTTDGIEETVDVRVGLGLGEVGASTDGSPTGPAWMLASDARRDAQELAARSRWPSSLRTVLRGGEDEHAAAINAYLLLQDQLLARMDASDRRALRGLLDGERQVDIAADLGVSQPAVARRVRDRGALAIASALAQWRAVEGNTATPGAEPTPTASTPPAAAPAPASTTAR
jgi:hypothetical protein